MLWRFCAYGFLKNQRYFEPYLMLILLDRGLSFFWIGVLEGTRAFTTNLLEVPSGAIADTLGRRTSMAASFVSYILSFVLFALGDASLPMLFAAMVLFGTGDAFRSGTHKAMILTYLKREGRADERTAYYGTTRSWSKLGSALSVVIGSIYVAVTGDLHGLFWLALAPYALDLVNLITYPAYLEGESARENTRASDVWRHLVTASRDVWSSRELRGMIGESAGFVGLFKSSKDYLQPILMAMVASGLLSQWLGDDLSDIQRVAFLVGPVYVALFLGSAAASRKADRLVRRAGDEEKAAALVWRGFAGAGALVLVGAFAPQASVIVVVGLALLYVLEALWRPIIVSRIDNYAKEEQGATVLSVESQARSLATIVLAPLLGAVIDHLAYLESGRWGVIGAALLLVGGAFSLRARRRQAEN